MMAVVLRRSLEDFLARFVAIPVGYENDDDDRRGRSDFSWPSTRIKFRTNG